MSSSEVALWLMVTLRLPLWSTASSTPVTVTVCAVFQLTGVKVRVADVPATPPGPCTCAAAGVPETTLTLTFPVGWLTSFTV